MENCFNFSPTLEIFPKKYWKEANGSVVHQSRKPISCPLGARKGPRPAGDKHCPSTQIRTKDKGTTRRCSPHTAAQEIEFCLSCCGIVSENMSNQPQCSATGQEMINAKAPAEGSELPLEGSPECWLSSALERSLLLCCCSLRCLLHLSSSATPS